MEVYEYYVTKFEPHTRQGILFSDYINAYFKRKAKGRGYPRWVRNTCERSVLPRIGGQGCNKT